VRTVTLSLQKIPVSTWALGFLFLLIYQSLDAGLNQLLEILFRSPDGTPNWVWFLAALSVLLNIVAPLLISFFLLSSLKGSRNWEGDFQQLMIETLRVWGKILLYTFFFIIPGLWKWMTTLYVPYVVLFSKTYSLGEADAIATSRAIFKKVWGRSLVVLLVFSFLIPLLVTSNFDQYREIWRTPVGAIVLGFADYISLILGLFILMKFFLKASEEVNHELVF
jgi:hypothetical protein